MRHRLLLLLTLIIAALGLAACGGDDGPGEIEGLSSYAPADAPLYIEANLEPPADQARAIEALARKLAGETDPVGLLIEELERAAAGDDFALDFESDIEPWLGSSAMLFAPDVEFAGNGIGGGSVESESAAAAIEVVDEAAAQEFVDRLATESSEPVADAEYEGVDYRVRDEGDGTESAVGLVEGAIVVGDEAAFQAAVDAVNGDSLAGEQSYQDAIEGLPGDELAHVFLDTERFLELATSAPGSDPEGRAALEAFAGEDLAEPFIVGVRAERDRIALDLAGPAGTVGTSAGELLSEIPSGAVAALGVGDLGSKLSALIDRLRGSDIEGAETIDEGLGQLEAQTGIDLEQDVLAWIGDAAVFATGDSVETLAAGVVIETTDPQASSRLLNQVAGFAAFAGGGAAPRGADAGFSIVQAQGAVLVAQRGDRVVITAAEAERAASELQDALGRGTGGGPALSEALDPEFEPGGFVDFAAVVALLDQVAGDDPDYAQVRRVLTALDLLVFGLSPDDEGRGQAAITVP